MEHAPEFESLLNDLEKKHYLIQLKYDRMCTKVRLLIRYSGKESIKKYILPTQHHA